MSEDSWAPPEGSWNTIEELREALDFISNAANAWRSISCMDNNISCSECPFNRRIHITDHANMEREHRLCSIVASLARWEENLVEPDQTE